jgi:uncharacterized membrane protein
MITLTQEDKAKLLLVILGIVSYYIAPTFSNNLNAPFIVLYLVSLIVILCIVFIIMIIYSALMDVFKNGGL